MYKVLLIEDSAELREVLAQYIESDGAMTVAGSADNPEDAIRALDDDDIDAVVIDLQLRDGTSGLPVLAHLERTGNPRGILRVVLTNSSTDVFRRGVRKLGAEHFFDKSMEFDQAIDVLAGDARRRETLRA